jgi:hypothetical protein
MNPRLLLTPAPIGERISEMRGASQSRGDGHLTDETGTGGTARLFVGLPLSVDFRVLIVEETPLREM